MAKININNIWQQYRQRKTLKAFWIIWTVILHADLIQHRLILHFTCLTHWEYLHLTIAFHHRAFSHHWLESMEKKKYLKLLTVRINEFFNCCLVWHFNRDKVSILNDWIYTWLRTLNDTLFVGTIDFSSSLAFIV